MLVRASRSVDGANSNQRFAYVIVGFLGHLHDPLSLGLDPLGLAPRPANLRGRPWLPIRLRFSLPIRARLLCLLVQARYRSDEARRGMVCGWCLIREGRGGKAKVSCDGLSSSGAEEQTRGKGQGRQQEQEMERELDNDRVHARSLCALPAM